jgi:hypothetical protein
MTSIRRSRSEEAEDFHDRPQTRVKQEDYRDWPLDFMLDEPVPFFQDESLEQILDQAFQQFDQPLVPDFDQMLEAPTVLDFRQKVKKQEPVSVTSDPLDLSSLDLSKSPEELLLSLFGTPCWVELL